MKTRLLSIIFFLSSIAIFAQDRPLPRGFAPGEEDQMSTYLNNIQTRNAIGITTPPNSPVRSMAEWEEIDGLVITWTGYREILTEIVRNSIEECEVVIICSNAGSVQSYLSNRGVDWSTNVRFVVDDFNSVWVRDYGANPCYINDVDSLILVDWIYNRPRPADDTTPEAIAEALDITLYETTATPTNLMNTGGNFMSDGMGMAFSSELVLGENDGNGVFNISYPIHSEAEVDAIMHDFMGIDTYIKMTNLPYDGIHHIDMHMKLLDEETLIVGEYPEGIADGPQIEANIQYVLNNFKTSYGNDFKVIRIPMPPDQFGRYPNMNGYYRTYTNSVFINKTILVPTYEEEFDTTALRIWEESMPGYNIVGIDCNDIIPASGAIHCITKEVGTSDPLLIQHEALVDVKQAQAAGYEAVATIKHRSGISAATLYYTIDLAATYESIPMNLVAGNDWQAIIPEQENGSTVYYYIQAEANSGRSQVRPLPAPAAYYSFDISYWPVSAETVLESPSSMDAAFPNPAAAMTCIPIQSKQSTLARIELQDIYGRLIHTVFEGQLPAGESKYFINAADYIAGTYLLVLKTENGQEVQKLIIE